MNCQKLVSQSPLRPTSEWLKILLEHKNARASFLRTAVHLDGVVNRRDTTDRGWTVELAFPWKGLELLRDGRSLPPNDEDLWRIDCSRFEKIGKHGEVLDTCVGWTWNRHGHYDRTSPEIFPYVTFSTQSVGERS